MRRLICAGLLLSCGLVLSGCGSSSAPPVAANPAPPAPVVAPVLAPPAPTVSATSTVVTPAVRAATIAPFVDDLTVAVVYVNLQQLDIEKSLAEKNRVLQLAGQPASPEDDKATTESFKSVQQQVLQAYGVVSLNDVPLRRPYIVLKLAPGADPKKVFALLDEESAGAPLDEKKYATEALAKDDLLVVGDEATILRLKTLTPTVLPNLEPAFQAAGESLFQLVIAPTDSARAQLGRMVGDLPRELNLNGPDLIAAIKYGVFTFDAPPNLQLKLEVQGQDASGAQRLQQAIQMSLDNFKNRPGMSPNVAEIVQALMPKVEAERLTISIKQGDAILDKASAFAMGTINSARDAAEQMKNSNNLKQIALGMLNNAAATGLLPQAKSQKDGMPLLSWRVHLLPMLGEQELYGQFKLDEPWDSATNLPLVKKMPSMYAKTPANQAAGTTTYLLPIGEKTAFTGNEALSLAQISDGTSNTLLVVDVSPDKAVTWTKPDDWLVDINNPFTGLPTKPFQGALCDGSVRTFSPTADAAQFARLITRNDGQPVDWAALAVNLPAAAANPFALTPGGAMPPGSVEPGREGSSTTIPGGTSSVPPGGVGPDGRPLVPGESLFITQAKQAFTEGRDRDGFNFLYAEAIAGEDKDGLKGTIRWVDAIKRPAMAIRWGVGIQYTAPRNYSGGPSVIGKIVQGGQTNTGNNNGVDPSAPQPGAPPATVLDYYTSELGTKLLDGLRTRSEQGQYGEVLKLIAGTPGVNNPNSSSQAMDRNGKPVVPKVQTIAPGIVFVGMGKDKELLAKAKEEELDGLIIFAVGVVPSRTRVDNTTKWIAYDVAKEKEIAESKAIKANVVEAARKENKGTDPVDDAMEKFFAAIDVSYKMGELPATATPDKVALFAGKLAESNPVNKLPILLAILFFQDKASLPAAEVKGAYEKLMGPELGVQLLGDVPQRQKAIATLLPKPPAGPNTPGGLGTGKRLGLGQ